MLTKMYQYKSGTVFTVAICLASILFAILVAYACDLGELERARDEAWDDYQAAEKTVETHMGRKPWYVVIGTVAATPGAVVRAGYVYAKTGALLGSLGSGGVILAVAAASAYIAWEGQLAMYESELRTARNAYYERVKDYEACANPPERYTYTDYRGNVYEFSTKEAYNDFLRNRGYSTI